jgi:hypothetical protein
LIQSPNKGGSECWRPVLLTPVNPYPGGHHHVVPSPAPVVVVPAVEGLVHMSGVGDVRFSNSNFAGSKGRSAALEGFSLSLRPHQHDLGIEYMCHAANVGDMHWVGNGKVY